jgi:hypothetical protein
MTNYFTYDTGSVEIEFEEECRMYIPVTFVMCCKQRIVTSSVTFGNNTT